MKFKAEISDIFRKTDTGFGLVLPFNIKDNLLLGRYYQEPFSDKGRLNHKYNITFAQEKVKEFNVMTSGIAQRVQHLSGGNQQKLILARELASQPEVLIAAQPTRGLDVAATKFVQRKYTPTKGSWNRSFIHLN
ncbi:MAG: ATP-binding cassette domain-containing protein [Zhaonellaceae bacterium]